MTGKGWDEYIAAYHAYERRAWFPDPYVGPPSDPKSPAFAFWAQEGDKAPADYLETVSRPGAIHRRRARNE